MRRWFIRIALAVLVPLAAVTLFLLAQLELGNFHEVLPGDSIALPSRRKRI